MEQVRVAGEDALHVLRIGEEDPGALVGDVEPERVAVAALALGEHPLGVPGPDRRLERARHAGAGRQRLVGHAVRRAVSAQEGHWRGRSGSHTDRYLNHIPSGMSSRGASSVDSTALGDEAAMSISPELGELRTAEIPAGAIDYRERGSGPAIVFVHGVGVNGDLWRRVVPELAGAGTLHHSRPPARGALPAAPRGHRHVASRPRADRRRPPRGARPRGRHDRRQRHRRRGRPVARGPPPGADRTARAHVVRRVREVPARLRSATSSRPRACPERCGSWPGRFSSGPCSGRRPPTAGPRGRRSTRTVMRSFTDPIRKNAGVRRDLARLLRAVDTRYTYEAAEVATRLRQARTGRLGCGRQAVPARARQAAGGAAASGALRHDRRTAARSFPRSSPSASLRRCGTSPETPASGRRSAPACAPALA